MADFSGGTLQKYIIAGIDPGATTAIALVDLSGKMVVARSFSGGMPEAVREIERHGTPSLVACDKTPPPEAVLRIASYFSCRARVPSHQIREEEKRLIARGIDLRNNHERDAYCAAVYAYRASANKLRQIDSLSEVEREDREKIKHLLLKGYRIQDAFAMLTEQEDDGRKTEGAQKPLQAHAKPMSMEEMKNRLSDLARENANLKMHIQRLEGEKGALEQKVRLFENGVRQTLMRDSEYRSLRFRLEQSLRRLSQRGAQKQKRQEPQKWQDKAKNEKSAQTQHKKSEMPQFSPKNSPARAQDTEGINNLVEPNFNLERLVEEYRKGRKAK